jgi:hypothetical protein
MSTIRSRSAAPSISSPLSPATTKLAHANATNGNGTSNGASNLSPSFPHADSDPTDLLPSTPQYQPRGSIPNNIFTIGLIAALLGGLTASSLTLASQPILRALGASSWTCARPRLGVYLAAMGIFHLMEFFTTAGWNKGKLSVDGECQVIPWSSAEICSIPPEQHGTIPLCPRRRTRRILHLVLLFPREIQLYLELDPRLGTL